MQSYKRHCCVSLKNAEVGLSSNRKDKKKKIAPRDGFVQTTKCLFDVGDEERQQLYQEAYLEAWKGRIASEAEAADREYYKFTLSPPSENYMRTPQADDSFYYIPEQHLQWTWRESRLKKRDPNIIMFRARTPQTHPHPQTTSKPRYSFDNGIYKILIR